MTPVPVHGSWSTQQLAEFVAAVSTAADEQAAGREAVERAAEVLDADVAALVRGGAVQASIGWPRFDVPERELVSLAQAGAGRITVPGIGSCPVAVVSLADEDEAQLVLARPEQDPFDAQELNLLRGMARSLALALRSLRMLHVERALRARSESQARENARLLDSLRERQRLLEALSVIQRSISHRAPLREVLDQIVDATGELLGDQSVALVMLDPDAAGAMLTVSSHGYDEAAIAATGRRRIGDGVAGRAVAEGRLIVVEDYARTTRAMAHFVEAGLTACMGAPVHENGEIIGSLVVSTREPGRTYSRNEQETLLAFAEHASLALTDAKTVGAMLHQALHDSLTGLPNRALFLDRLGHAVSRANRNDASLAVLFLDLDRFKTVNDSLGHAAGDELLVAVAARLDGCMRAADTAARLGGDEFAVLLEDLADPEEAIAVAQRVIDALRCPVLVQGREVFVSASIGVATGGGAGSDLLRHADVAMYRAKAEGKGRFAVYESGMQAEVLERLELEGDLQRALERGELVLFYQPIVALRNGGLAGFEALVRWRHPNRGLVAPAAFIPVAEETGLIVEIGRFVLREACRQAAAWAIEHPTGGQRSMNVNLSGRQLDDPRLVDDVADVLAETGLTPSSLVLEITETVLMQDTEVTMERLQALKALGVRLAVDDFGTGYSSLRYLRRFPIDVLKIAKPFVDGLAGGEGTAVARAIVDLGAGLGLEIVAEGIEHSAQLEQLQRLTCRLGQGFYFQRPLDAAGMGAVLSRPGEAVTWSVGDPGEGRMELIRAHR